MVTRVKVPKQGHHTKTLIKKQKSKKQYKIPNTKKSTKPRNPNKNSTQTNTDVNILSSNAAGLRHKCSDLKNKIKYFKSTIFSLQETHYRKKGQFQMDNYHIFEAICKSKQKGGTMVGVHMDLEPVLVKEYSDQFELLVIEIKIGDSKIRLMSGYWEEHERTPFFEAMESEVVRSELEGRSIIICMDANSKLGTEYIKEDPHPQSRNGKLLANILDRHALVVANGLQQKCTGLITREKHTKEGSEKSVIDFVVMSSDLVSHIEYVHIDDKITNVLTKLVKSKKNQTKKVESDHNIIDVKLNLPWKTKTTERIEVFNFKDKLSQDKFFKATEN